MMIECDSEWRIRMNEMNAARPFEARYGWYSESPHSSADEIVVSVRIYYWIMDIHL